MRNVLTWIETGQSAAARGPNYQTFAVRAPRDVKHDIAALLNVNSANAERFKA